MPKVDNDTTRSMAQGFIIIAQRRAGGTYLSHCLSNHPQVFCDRAESAHHGSVWRKAMPKLPLPRLLELLMNQEGYNASGCKLVYTQAMEAHSWKLIEERRPFIIHLTRDNKLRQAISIYYNQKVRKGKLPFYPVHSVKAPTGLVPVHIEPQPVIDLMMWLEKWQKKVSQRIELAKLNSLHVTYTDMVRGEGRTRPRMVKETSYQLCNFLGVRRLILGCDLKRVHSHSLQDWIQNYDEFVTAIKDTRFAHHLEDEQVWR